MTMCAAPAAAHIVAARSTEGNSPRARGLAMLPINYDAGFAGVRSPQAWPHSDRHRLMTITFCFAANALPHDVPLWSKIADDCQTDPLSYVVSDCMTVDVNPAVLRLQDVDLRLELPDGLMVRATRVDAGPFAKDGFIWHGVVSTSPYSRVTFSTVNDVVVGTIVTNGKMYRLRQTTSGTTVVERLDRALLYAGEHETPPPPPPPPPPPLPPPSPSDTTMQCLCASVLSTSSHARKTRIAWHA